MTLPRDLIVIHPIPLIHANRLDTCTIVILPNINTAVRLLPPLIPTRTTIFLHQLPQQCNLALDRVLFRKDALDYALDLSVWFKSEDCVVGSGARGTVAIPMELVVGQIVILGKGTNGRGADGDLRYQGPTESIMYIAQTPVRLWNAVPISLLFCHSPCIRLG